MKIVNILFNYKKSTNEKRILGVERCFVDYTKNLIASDNELLSITQPNMVYADEIKKTGSQFFELPAFGQADILSVVRLAILFFIFKPDVIICHSGRALFFARAARFVVFIPNLIQESLVFLLKKIVVKNEASQSDAFQNKKTKPIFDLKFPIIGIDHGVNPKKFLKADYVLTVNSYFSKELVKAGKPANRAFVIPNMIEIPKDFTPLAKQEFRVPIRLGSLGRVYSEKYFDKVLRAMATLRDRGIVCQYIIGGVGPMEKSLNELAVELKLENNFKILGWVEDKRKFFDSIDIFILPSEYETFGIVLLEAMLYSTPIVTSNSWGPDEIIADGIDGLKVSKDNSAAMPRLIADAIEKLAEDQDFAKKLASQAYEKFLREYSAVKVTEKLSQIIKTVVDQGI